MKWAVITHYALVRDLVKWFKVHSVTKITTNYASRVLYKLFFCSKEPNFSLYFGQKELNGNGYCCGIKSLSVYIEEFHL